MSLSSGRRRCQMLCQWCALCSQEASQDQLLVGSEACFSCTRPQVQVLMVGWSQVSCFNCVQVLQLIQERGNLCKQIHLPAQSGSSRVLDAMCRGSETLPPPPLPQSSETLCIPLRLSSPSTSSAYLCSPVFRFRQQSDQGLQLGFRSTLLSFFLQFLMQFGVRVSTIHYSLFTMHYAHYSQLRHLGLPALT